MKMKYEAEKGSRMNYGFIGFTTIETSWWFNYTIGKWEHNPVKKLGCGNYSSHQICRTVKAFRRKLKAAPKGVRFILVNRWIGCDVVGYGNNSN